MSSLMASLQEVRAESEVLIVAPITKFLLSSSGDGGTIPWAIDPVLSSFSSTISQFCNARPNFQVSCTSNSSYYLIHMKGMASVGNSMLHYFSDGATCGFCPYELLLQALWK